MTMPPGPSLRGGLIVSCQAALGSPLGEPRIMAALAQAAVAGGARAIRVNGAADIRAVKAAVRVPIIGLLKRRVDGSAVYITPTLADAIIVAEAGADFVALDATLRPRPDGVTLPDVIGRLRALGVGVIADVDDVDAGIQAARAGADFVASTLAGYTSGETPGEPDIQLIRVLTAATTTPVIAEGRYHEPSQVRAAFDAGAHAVVVGQAITDLTAITRRFVAAAEPAQPARGRSRSSTQS